jgi:hypothetical protein
MKCSRKFLTRHKETFMEETFATGEELTHATARRPLRGAKLVHVGGPGWFRQTEISDGGVRKCPVP